MAVTNIPNVQNWTVTPQNGQPSYFTLMNTWLGQSTLVIASLQTAITAQNTANSEINALAIQTENYAFVANGLANFQGTWSNSIAYSKGQSVERTTGSKIYYTSKQNNNLNHAVTDPDYWLYNPINDKLNTDFSLLTDKTTASDTDIFAIRESGGLLKKLSWANLKATLKTYFDTLYMALTGNQTIAGVKTFSSTIVGDITGNAGTATKLSTTRVNYKGTTDSVVAGELMWKKYGNNHTIFDASSSTTPTGVAKNNTNPDFAWGVDCPTLMGYNGINTFGVRVDSSRYADSAENAKYAAAFTTAVGSAPSYACRAWVNFNGIGTVAIRASGNVSSITDMGTGYYTVNFTTAMIDVNYSEIVGTGIAAAPVMGAARAFCTGSRLSTSISVAITDNNVDNAFDMEVVSVAVFR